MYVIILKENPLSLRHIKDNLEENAISVVEIYDENDFFEFVYENEDDLGVFVFVKEGKKMDVESIICKTKNIEKTKDIPIIVLSNLKLQKKNIEKKLELGIFDYISKPLDPELIYLKIRNALKSQRYICELKRREKNIMLMSEDSKENYRKIDELNRRLLEKNKILEVLVEARTKELQDMTHSLISALENANLYNDENTGRHIQRVAEYSEVIARGANLDRDFIKELKLYAPLHDIGKVGISDAILKKPGYYTKMEFESMKQHVLIGYNMIKDSSLSDVAKNIIKYHHEKWDGSGYVHGLNKEKIPIEARIVAIADVFDALTTKRSYKEEFSIEKTLNIMKEGSGKHFDPFLLDLFLENLDKVLLVKGKFGD